MPDESINISDVIEVIETDPDFQESTMFNGGGEISRPVQQQQQPSQQQHRSRHKRQGVRVEILEQPAAKALRFRYECEGRSAGSIPGANSTPENKTFPTIKVEGYRGRAVVVVSCVTKDDPYRPHPHNLVGREGCKRGVCTMEIPQETMMVTFSNLGIQCVKKKDIEVHLRVREEIKVDPFLTGFDHRNQPASIDLNAVKLCFQVFLEGDRPGKFTVPLPPVVSQTIYDKKAMSDLVIVKLSDCVCYADGGRKDLILLCEKVAKEDIQVRFFEERNDQLLWEAYGDFQPSQVHKQTAICFKPPKYHTLEITEAVKVSIQLKRPSDGAVSEALPFEFLPLDSVEPDGKRKRQKIDEKLQMVRHLEEKEKLRHGPPPQHFLNIPMEAIKIEPRDKTPSPYGGQVYQQGASPNYARMMPNVSPHHYALSPNPQPALEQFAQQNVLPPINSIQQQTNYNLPSTSAMHWSAAPLPNDQNVLCSAVSLPDEGLIENPPGVSSLLNLDNQELAQFGLDGENLSETFKNNLSLTDFTGGAVRPEDQNMDSLTRLTNNAYDEINAYARPPQ